jgi:hypothetical protein
MTFSTGTQKRIEDIKRKKRDEEEDRAWKQGVKFGYLGGRNRRARKRRKSYVKRRPLKLSRNKRRRTSKRTKSRSRK